MSKGSSEIDGILNVNKPAGMTSMDVVRRVKRASGQRRVGHGGTLDPIACGVVPVCIGQATRFMEYLLDGRKEYLAVVTLGVETDTYDADGEVTETGDASHVTLPDAESVLSRFVGRIQQVPPMYSALKKDGKRLYDLARQGIVIEREPREVVVYSAQVESLDGPELTIRVQCGRGFYMRSLAHDIGAVLGCGGHLKFLERTQCGVLHVDDAVSLECIEDSFREDEWPDIVQAPDVVVQHHPAIVVGREVEASVRNGRALPSLVMRRPATGGDRCRVYSVDGRFLAVMMFDAEAAAWKPDKVIPFKYPRQKAMV